ncbi:MAG TPA: CDP-diacylglycerol--serine O-phosphatidyltransferase [Rickettsiales bacterium]|nr:CDP-diacylglycerol--serine O-phosphatidyltransferase [Rickettsiales bacterium]
MNRQKSGKRRLLAFPVSRLFPNMVTIAGLCCGISAMRFAIDGKFELAVTLLVAAAVIDGMDGRIARFLNSTSTFGAHLDSLSDFVCFGVSPAMVLYLWRLNEVKSIGWAMVLFFAVCCVLRLARFNTNLADETIEPWQKKFFTGVPAPAGAMLGLMPLVASFYVGNGIWTHAPLCAIWLALVGVLMASRIPTIAAKKLIITHEWVLPIMLVVGLIIVCVIIEPWLMFTVGGLLYCLSLPVGVLYYYRLARKYKLTSSDI